MCKVSMAESVTGGGGRRRLNCILAKIFDNKAIIAEILVTLQSNTLGNDKRRTDHKA